MKTPYPIKRRGGLVIAVFAALFGSAATICLAAERMWILEWATDAKGMIEIQVTDGSWKKEKAPLIPAAGVLATLLPSGEWTVAVGGKQYVIDLQAVRRSRPALSKQCPKVSGSNETQLVSRGIGCD